MSVAIITGASSGMGADFAEGYAGRVDELWLVARRRERMVELGERLGVKYKVICADLSVKDGIDKRRLAHITTTNKGNITQVILWNLRDFFRATLEFSFCDLHNACCA